MGETPETSAVNLTALDRMQEKEEVLEICYWFQGEGFGDRFTPQAVMPFLRKDATGVSETFERLGDEGALVRDGDAYRFTEAGRRRAGKMFFDTFTEFQQASHGECTAGCCDGDDPCEEHGHAHAHGHAG